jgi:hypothetical protein
MMAVLPVRLSRPCVYLQLVFAHEANNLVRKEEQKRERLTASQSGCKEGQCECMNKCM